jgi:hypothetical protein
LFQTVETIELAHRDSKFWQGVARSMGRKHLRSPAKVHEDQHCAKALVFHPNQKPQP